MGSTWPSGAEVRSQQRLRLGQPHAVAQRLGALDADRKVRVAEVEPDLLAEPAQRVHHMEAVALETPALCVDPIGQPERDQIGVRRDVGAVDLDVVAGVGDDCQLLGADDVDIPRASFAPPVPPASTTTDRLWDDGLSGSRRPLRHALRPDVWPRVAQAMTASPSRRSCSMSPSRPLARPAIRADGALARPAQGQHQEHPDRSGVRGRPCCRAGDPGRAGARAPGRRDPGGGGRSHRRRRARWVVDPLDGTVNYLYGLPTFAVSVAVQDADGGIAAAGSRSGSR